MAAAGTALGEVRAPTLLIVRGEDTPVIAMNRAALQELSSREKQLVATHLFEEPGRLEEVARLAADRFEKYLPAAKPS
jgi:putative phosphoribosyl transferase